MSPQSGPAFELAGVTKSYRVWRRLRPATVPGIRDVSLTVARGTIFGLLGLNGAGKTTTMKLLVGILAPQAGTVSVLGGPVADPAIRARIGYLPELPYLPLQLRAREVLGHYGRMTGLAGADLARRIDRALELTRLDTRHREPLRTYSKGMLQRVAMAQAILHDPAVVFADEPMSGLDPEGLREMRLLLLDLKRAGVTVCLNSHQIAEVERVCDRIGIIVAGRLVREGGVGELLAQAGDRRYRVTVLAAAPGGGWRPGDFEVGEDGLAAALAERRQRGERVLQILAQRGSLEEVLLETIRGAGG